MDAVPAPRPPAAASAASRQDAAGARAFRLTRFFSITSLLGILVVTACLVWTYRELTERHLVDHESRANVDMTRAFANMMWGKYRRLVLESSGRDAESLRADPAIAELRSDVLHLMRGLKIAKVKVYNRQGLTVFSTDAKQIGEDKSGNEGFARARDGRVASLMVFRETFDAFEGTLSNRNLIASYIPVRHDGGDIEGVFEVYSDVTELLASQHEAQWRVAALVFALLATLYVFLLGLVRKADFILARQERERVAKEAEVRHLAYHDALTGLPNRAAFGERLRELLEMRRRDPHECVLMFVDMDRFKIVNDSLGHDAGDLVLRTVAERLTACLRSGDQVFRVGGDEFTVVLPEVKRGDDAAAAARRVIQALAAPVTVLGRELSVGATVGIAVHPADGVTAEELVRNADAAMYAAKVSAPGGHAFYRPEMNRRASQRLETESAVKKAVQDGELVAYYQPRVDPVTRRVVALEALLRWQSPTRGLVGPGQFLDVLHETGLMPQVSAWMLRTVCRQMRAWEEAGHGHVRVSVNVSASQFQSPSFPDSVRQVLAETGARAERLELEMTESVIMSAPEQARDTIRALRDSGVAVSIDDFGTGYSSLNYLRLFPVDYLKIDRSFVMGIAGSERDRELARGIVELARALRITVVAEGVETEQQAGFFSGLQCGELQGFLFAPALPAEAITRVLAGAPLPAAPSPGTPRPKVEGGLQPPPALAE